MSRLQSISPNLYLFADTCNAYVVTHAQRALIIDCASGAVADHLSEIGVHEVDWLLFTHHHRDQCFGAGKFSEQNVPLAVPHHERFLFERADEYWQQKRLFDNYNDRSTFFSISESLPVAESLRDYENFTWGPYSFLVLPAPGHTQGSVALIADIDGTRVAFTGDLLHADGKLYQLHAMEYEYGDLAGANWTAQSIHALSKQQVQIALPSHGPVIDEPAECIQQLDQRLHRLLKLMRDRVAGTADGRFAHEIKMEQITPHLLWGTAETCSNFYVIKSESGKSLFIDYPYASTMLFMTALHSAEPFAQLRFVEHHLDELCEEWGIESFDVVIPTHIHDDHVCGIPYLQRHHGTQCWSLDEVAKLLEAPSRWNTPCLMETPLRIDRRFTDGQRFQWEEYEFEIVFYPGQTEFHAAIFVEIDGRRVLFAGDSSYPLKRYLPERDGEWMINSVLRNSLTFGMHRKCADEFDRLRPDLLCPGHGTYWDVPPEAFAAHREYVEQKEAIWRDLLPAPAELGVDLFWTRIVPYQLQLSQGEAAPLTVALRNSFEEDATFEVTLSSHLNLAIEPQSQSLRIAAGDKGALQFQVSVESVDPAERNRRHLVTADVTVNGQRHGPVGEALVVLE